MSSPRWSAGTTLGSGRRFGTSACLLIALALPGCSGGGGEPPGPERVAIDGERVESRLLAEAVTELCLAREQASTDPRAATMTYDRGSRSGIAQIARALQEAYSVQASAIIDAAQVVEADIGMEPPPPSLALHLARLTEVARHGLARLGIVTPPCER